MYQNELKIGFIDVIKIFNQLGMLLATILKEMECNNTFQTNKNQCKKEKIMRKAEIKNHSC